MTSSNDYYTTDMLHEIWSPTWFDDMFRNGAWCSGDTPVNPIQPNWQSYHPYACNSCKRGPALTNTALHTCTGCRVMKYCSREHQRHDWKFHKDWCKAFAKLCDQIDMTSYASREEWSRSLPIVTSQLSWYMNSVRKHTTDIQLAIAQPRCRKCFKSGIDRNVKLSTCPRCMGVALCGECLEGQAESNHETFHCDTDQPTAECDGHLLSICCSAMIVEQGNPLGPPSATDSPVYWKPQDWRDYLSAKRGDYELPELMFNMAPVVSFITDAHSLTLTIQHILSLPELSQVVDAPNLSKMVIHVCGAALNEEAMTGRYVEMIRLNPALTEFQLHLIGPDIQDQSGACCRATLQYEQIRASCKVSVETHPGLYHEIAGDLQDTPTLVICPHSGMHDPSYTSTWRPTIEMLADKDIPFVLTGYNHKEIMEDTELLRDWGASVIVPPTNNPFRGLRPFLDPGRDPDDVIFTNASFVVAKGRAVADALS